MSNKEIRVFTDGASSGNPGPGGWGAIVATHSRVKELGNGEEKTTNNRMELLAVIEALSFINKNDLDDTAVIHSDSKYVINGATKWIINWKKNDWKSAQKKDVLNKDLWERLDDLLSKVECKWQLLQGHSGIPGNERTDKIATSFSKKEKIELFDGPLSHYEVDLNKTKAEPGARKSNDRSKAKAYSYLSLVNGVVVKHSTWKDCEERVKGKKDVKFRKSISPEDEADILKQWGK